MEIIISLLVSFVVTVALGYFLIPALRRLKAGQSIKEIGPTWHMSKQGTPTLGGLMFIGGICVATVAAGWSSMMKGEFAHLLVLGFALVFGVIGFIDDYQKVKHHRNTGLTALQKFLLQLVASIVFVLLLRKFNLIPEPNLYIPFLNTELALSWPVYMVFAAFVMVGTVNAVNITDGVDGLAAGVTLPVSVFFITVAVWYKYTHLGVFSAALAGGLVAFLIYNYHPAKVFMGDTGSLFLGGVGCGVAFALGIPLVIPLIGLIYVAEVLSDIIQVAYFKLSHGKRIFRMAPLHHHLELGGWSEVKLFYVFTLLTLALCALAFFGVMNKLSA